MLILDIIMKMVMMRDITAMDDYVKSRPVPEKIWNKFLLTTNLVSFWNYVLPVLTLPVFIYLLPASEAVASFFLFLEFSFVNGIYITCYRKATKCRCANASPSTSGDCPGIPKRCGDRRWGCGPGAGSPD